MDRGFVGADEHAAAPQVAEVLDGRLRLFRQPEQPLGVVAQQAAGVGQRGVLGGAVEQPLADALLEPPDRLADRRLGPVQLHGRPREAAFGRDPQEDAQFGQFHGSAPCLEPLTSPIIQTRINYHFDIILARRVYWHDWERVGRRHKSQLQSKPQVTRAYHCDYVTCDL